MYSGEGLIHTDRENGVKKSANGPILPRQLLPLGSLRADTILRVGRHHHGFLFVYLQLKTQGLPANELVRAVQSVHSHLDAVIGLHYGKVTAKLPKGYIYFCIMENSLLDMEFLVLICFLWKEQWRWRQSPKLGH